MRLQIKNVNQKVFEVRVQLSETIQQVKDKINLMECIEPENIADQKLIYSGNILSDDSTVEECHFDEGKSVTLIYNPKKFNNQNKVATGDNTNINKMNNGGKAESASPEDKSNCDNVSLAKLNSSTNDIQMSTGCSEKLVEKASQAASNKWKIAINGIPDRESANLLNSSDLESEDLSRDKLMAAIPNFNNLVAIIRNNPVELKTVLSKLSAERPNVLKRILENKDAFIDLVNREMFDSNIEAIDVNEELREKDCEEVVDRLAKMGFEKGLVMQAYQACGLDENGTVELLLALKN